MLKDRVIFIILCVLCWTLFFLGVILSRGRMERLMKPTEINQSGE